MRNRTIFASAFAILSLGAMTQLTSAQGAGDAMAKPKTYTGCVAAGATSGTFMLTHAMADAGKDTMSKDAMKKDTMGKDAMAAHDMTISSTTVDLSKHVGHQVSVSGTGAGMAKPDAMSKPDTMAKPDAMGKKMPALDVTSLKMVAATCSM